MNLPLVKKVSFLSQLIKAIEDSLSRIRESIGEIPIVESEERLRDGSAVTDGVVFSSSPTSRKGPKVLADGTYATESAYVSTSPTSPTFDLNRKSSIRGMYIYG